MHQHKAWQGLLAVLKATNARLYWLMCACSSESYDETWAVARNVQEQGHVEAAAVQAGSALNLPQVATVHRYLVKAQFILVPYT